MTERALTDRPPLDIVVRPERGDDAEEDRPARLGPREAAQMMKLAAYDPDIRGTVVYPEYFDVASTSE